MVIPVFGAFGAPSFVTTLERILGIMGLRTYALYHHNRIFKRVLICLYLACIPLVDHLRRPELSNEFAVGGFDLDILSYHPSCHCESRTT